ncbi:hypothetical protein ACFV1W_28035 [Kitasatospora sp. NPDC059648]|uniref:hypothetical protein n=1 Tax=Kitasatospora sp. NPDC059648 TaxID=3346894 RepID=UPI00369ED802
MSKVADLQKAQKAMTSIGSVFIGAALFDAIGKALAVGAPVGNPGTIRERAKAYTETAKAYGKASTDLATAATNQLPAAWTGSVAEHAGQAVQALANELTVSQEALQQAASVLGTWADDLEWAQNTDKQGVTSLRNAEKSIAGDVFDNDRAIAALGPAQTGLATRLAAAQRAESSGTHTASVISQLAAKARAERAGQGPIDPLAALVLANEKGPGGTADGDYILTPGQLDRAGQFLNVMNGTDQAAFRSLLSGAKSPEEAAYLWKALAAGHSMTDVQRFATLIHPHGDDPAWLAQHLVPALGKDGDLKESTTEAVSLNYQGTEYDSNGRPVGSGSMNYNQGGVNDCAAASTVVAHLKLDPVTMLQLTTGNTPDVPGADSPGNFGQRLQELYIDRYNQALVTDGSLPYPLGTSGIYPKGSTFLSNQDLGKATGTTYEFVSLNTEDDRRAAVARIEKAVDEGKPVPFSVYGNGGKDGHQMVIMARDGDRLQVYNPWGRSEWVTEDQFIHDRMNAGHITDSSDMNTANGAELPK